MLGENKYFSDNNLPPHTCTYCSDLHSSRCLKQNIAQSTPQNVFLGKTSSKVHPDGKIKVTLNIISWPGLVAPLVESSPGLNKALHSASTTTSTGQD